MLKSAYINSANRDMGGSSENFTITDSASLFTYPPKAVKLTKANIPYTWYNVVSTNNQVILIEQPNPGVLATIPVGNYTGTSLASALQTALNAVAVLHTYTVTFNTLTQFFTITGSAGTFSLDFSTPNSAAARLGFAAGVTTTPAITTTSTQLAQIQSDNELWICSNLVGGCDNGFVLMSSATPSNTQILAVVPITGTFGDVINYVAPVDDPYFPTTQSEYGKVPTPGVASTPKSMSFFLAFPSGFALGLNGQNWSNTLTFSFE